jgi:hypothetical protein
MGGGSVAKKNGLLDIDVDVKRAQKATEKLPGLCEQAAKRVVSDMGKRIPPKVKKGIKEVYAVDNAGANSAKIQKKKGVSINSPGAVVESLAVVYKGRALSLQHFHQKQKGGRTRRKDWQRIPGQAVSTGSPVVMMHQPKPYKVVASIIKGQVTEIKGPAFIAKGLAFQRKATNPRLPIKAVKGPPVPAMITNDEASEIIQRYIDEVMEKRTANAIKQMQKKL